MTDNSVVRTRWLRRVMLCLALLIVPLVGTACGSSVCSIFNCDTLFFMEDLSQALHDLGGNAGDGDDTDMDGDDHDDDGDMDMDGDDHDEGDEDDDHGDG